MSGHLCCCSGEGRAQRRRLESSVPWCPSPVVVSDVYNPSWRWPTFQRQLAAPDLVPFTSREPLRAIQTTPRKASICLSLKGNRNIKYFPVDLHEWCWHWGLCSRCEITFQGQNKTTYLCTWTLTVLMDLRIDILRACLALKGYVFRSVPPFLIGCWVVAEMLSCVLKWREL